MLSAGRGRIRKSVFQLCSTYGAFAATKTAPRRVTVGSTWSDFGTSEHAGMSFETFTPQDGSVVTWGDADWGGNSSYVQDQLYIISWVSGTFRAFLEHRENGTFFLGDDASPDNQI